MEVDDYSFEEKVINQSRKKPVVVDFFAAWCAPCSMLAPILEKAVDSYKGKVILAKVNVDENPATSTEYGIEAIPAVKIFKDGKIAAEFTGLVPEDTIRKKIDSVLN